MDEDVSIKAAIPKAWSRFYRPFMWWCMLLGMSLAFLVSGQTLLRGAGMPSQWVMEATWTGVAMLATAALLGAIYLARRLIIRPRRWIWTLGVFALAFILRAAAVTFIPYAQSDDFLVYHQSAIGVAQHGVQMVPASGKHEYYCFYPPGEVHTLGGLYRLVGGDGLMSIGDSPRYPQTPAQWSAWNRCSAAGMWLNVVLASLTAVGIGYIGRLTLGELPGRVAGALAALLPSSVFACFLLGAEVPQTFWVVMALCAYVKWINPPRTDAGTSLSLKPAGDVGGSLHGVGWSPTRGSILRGGLITGVCLGIACLFRPTFMPVFALLTLHALLTLPRKRQALLAGAVILLAMSAMIAPWTTRNYIVTGAFIPISSNGGGNLYSGNNDLADGGYTPEAWVELFTNSPDDTTLNRLGAQKAKEWIVSHPKRFGELAWAKFGRFWNTDRDMAWWALEAPGDFPKRQAWAPPGYKMPDVPMAFQKAGEGASTGFYYAIIAATVAALIVRRRDLLTSSGWIIIPLLMAFLSVVHMVFESQAKYHYTLVPLLCALAAGVAHSDKPTTRQEQRIELAALTR